MIEKISELIGKLIGLFIIGGIVTFTYNEIALAFNLPNFSYWVCLGAYFTLKKLKN